MPQASAILLLVSSLENIAKSLRCVIIFFKTTHTTLLAVLYIMNSLTQVIDETLSPTWDELLVFEEVLVYGRREDIKANPPSVIIEIYDQDKVI